MANKEVCIFGNGRSLKDFDFKKIDREKYDVIGCCMAFRHWNKIDWFPDIYVNVDTVVCQNPEVIEFIKQKKCKFYVLSVALKEVWKDYPKDGTIFFLEELIQFPMSSFKYIRNWCSGSACVIASLDRYRKLHLFGFDCDYVEFIPECIQEEDGTLTIETTPETNPNYFVDDYQRKGDRYNKPNGETIHMKSWEELSYIIDFINKMYPEYKVDLTNYNSKKSISQYFTTKTVKKFDC
tara:strand:- start:2655 stop:3365 length:711 start_codon:yes stop_codon:yes gene_type:complete